MKDATVGREQQAPGDATLAATPSPGTASATSAAGAAALSASAAPAAEAAGLSESAEAAEPAEPAEPLSNDREHMLATLSHDLKNPLSAILVGAQNLTRLPVSEELAPRLRRYAEAIQRAGHRMNDLLRDLLDLTRLELATLPLERTPRDAAGLVAAALRPLETAAAARQITLRSHAPADLVAACDERRVAQVIGNMVANAVKFSREGGVVDVAVERRGPELLFSVRDSGAGISATELPKVFGPYWHGSDNPRRGMGVGMPLAKAIVEAHGGRIWADSVEGQGSAFFFTLPVA